MAAGVASAFVPVTPSSLAISSKFRTFPSALQMADYSLDPSSTAFVFIEYQNEFTTEGGKLHDAVKDCMTKTNSKSFLL